MLYINSSNVRKFVVVLTLISSGCGLHRNPVPLDSMSDSKLPGFPKVRYWEIEFAPDINVNESNSSQCDFLALSGGGETAHLAGFLSGWTASGTRPEFRIVTGISTGSLIAPLAFLGSQCDEILKNSYTNVSTKDILYVEGLLGFGIAPVLLGESYASSKPLQKLIDQLVDEKALKAIAAEHAKGRRLYIGTTNLDAQRIMIWDMGAIASIGTPDAVKLFRKVVLASSSIPGAFPPVFFDVDVNGKKYDEMHVDGGTIVEVFGYGQMRFPEKPAGICRIYVIRNGILATESMQVPRGTFKIITRSFDTLMKAHSWKDIFSLYFIAHRDKVEFNYVSIPDNYQAQGKEMFDPVEMKRLFDLGYDMAKSGYKWNKIPPGIRDTNELTWTP